MTESMQKNTERSATACFLLAACCVQLFGASSPDKDWLLLAARMWLQGKTLYGDIFESNPPLIVWIYALPAFAAQRIPAVDDVHMLTLMGLIASLLSIRLSLALMSSHPQFIADASKRGQFLLLLAFLLIWTLNPAYFSDREHIVMLCIVPYILRFMPGMAQARFPMRLRVLTGCAAGFGFCIKPHCLLLFAGLQAIVIFHTRHAAILKCLENRIIYAMGIAYGLLVALAAPEYFTVVLPMAMATYSGYNMRINQPFYTLVAFFSLAVAFIDFRPRHASPWRRDIIYLLSCCLLGLAYALFNNGWGYTFVPLFTLIQLTIAFVCWEYRWLYRQYAARGLPVRSFIFGWRACIFVFLTYAVAALTTDYLNATYDCAKDPDCAISRFAKTLQEEHVSSFGTLTADFNPWTQLARHFNLDWRTRFNHLWMLPALAVDKDVALGHAWIPAYVAHALAEDLTHNRPDMVMVDVSPEFYTTRRHMDLIAYFGAYSAFDQAWQSYRYIRTMDFCTSRRQEECRYALYERRP